MMNHSNAGTRAGWVDNARGIGILLVVIGHVDRGLIGAGLADHAGPLQAVDRWIYSFHMPLFFLLSGLFAEHRVSQTFLPFFTRQLRVLGYPYLLWSVIQTSVQIAFSGATNHPATWRDLLRIPIAPTMQFWFLYSLLLVSFFYKGLRTLSLTPRMVLLTSCVLVAMQPSLPANTWSVLRSALVYFPFYALGAALEETLNSVAREKRPSFLIGCAALSFLALTVLVGSGFHSPLSGWLGPVRACLGITGTLALAMVAARALRLDWLTVRGRASLQIYVAHTIASAGTRIVLLRLGVRDVSIHVVLGTAFGVLVPLMLANVVEHYRIPYVFSWPNRSVRTSPER